MTTKAKADFWDDEDEEENVDDLLGSRSPAVKFPEIGASVDGVILSMTRGIQRDLDGTVKTWDDGSPRIQAILTLQTKLAEDETDDGERRLFVKGMMVAAMREAMKAAKVKGPRPGGHLVVTFTGEAKPTAKGRNPAKLFTVTYEPPK